MIVLSRYETCEALKITYKMICEHLALCHSHPPQRKIEIFLLDRVAATQAKANI